MTGARISFLVGRRDVIPACKKLRTQMIWQVHPGAESRHCRYDGPLEPIKAQCAEYQRRRDALCGGFRSIGWDVPDSHGSMFVWAPDTAGARHQHGVLMEMIEKAGVICAQLQLLARPVKATSSFALTLPVAKIAEPSRLSRTAA